MKNHCYRLLFQCVFTVFNLFMYYLTLPVEKQAKTSFEKQFFAVILQWYYSDSAVAKQVLLVSCGGHTSCHQSMIPFLLELQGRRGSTTKDRMTSSKIRTLEIGWSHSTVPHNNKHAEEEGWPTLESATWG